MGAHRDVAHSGRNRRPARTVHFWQKVGLPGGLTQAIEEKLAQSPNATVVVIGAGKDGLPLILDTK